MIYTQALQLKDKSYMTIYADEEHVLEIKFEKTKSNPNYLTKLCLRQLEEYFAGSRKVFELPIKAKGTEFQQKVWSELLQIQYGKYLTYKEIAQKVGGVNYSRAVGMACNKNPLPIVIPCHRVLGSNKSLTGYAGGICLKKKLLRIESIKTV